MDSSKVSQTAPTTAAAPSTATKSDSKSRLNSASLLPSTYFGDRPVAKPASLHRQRSEVESRATVARATATTNPAKENNRKHSLLDEPADAQTPNLQMGDLAPNSIFADEALRDESEAAAAEPGPIAEKDSKISKPEPMASQVVLNPRPKARALWHRRMIVRSIRRRGRLTKEQKILRTERFSLSKSHFFKTSIKKLAPLARQIAGKPIDEAILQMRFSKKKAARDVLDHLRHAKNEAIVRKGIGLSLQSSIEKAESSASSNHPSSHSKSITSKTKVSLLPPSPILSPRRPKLQASRPRYLSKADLSKIYISQAWVNRGPYGKEPEYRAMGRTNLLRPPHTGISVLLKEERTKVREQRGKEEKAERRRRRVAKAGDGGMWMPMPDRKITSTESHVLW